MGAVSAPGRTALESRCGVGAPRGAAGWRRWCGRTSAGRAAGGEGEEPLAVSAACAALPAPPAPRSASTLQAAGDRLAPQPPLARGKALRRACTMAAVSAWIVSRRGSCRGDPRRARRGAAWGRARAEPAPGSTRGCGACGACSAGPAPRAPGAESAASSPGRRRQRRAPGAASGGEPGRAQAAAGHVLEKGAPGGGALAAHAPRREQGLPAVAPRADGHRQRDRRRPAVDPRPDDGAVEDEAHGCPRPRAHDVLAHGRSTPPSRSSPSGRARGQAPAPSPADDVLAHGAVGQGRQRPAHPARAGPRQMGPGDQRPGRAWSRRRSPAPLTGAAPSSATPPCRRAAVLAREPSPGHAHPLGPERADHLPLAVAMAPAARAVLGPLVAPSPERCLRLRPLLEDRLDEGARPAAHPVLDRVAPAPRRWRGRARRRGRAHGAVPTAPATAVPGRIENRRPRQPRNSTTSITALGARQAIVYVDASLCDAERPERLPPGGEVLNIGREAGLSVQGGGRERQRMLMAPSRRTPPDYSRETPPAQPSRDPPPCRSASAQRAFARGEECGSRHHRVDDWRGRLAADVIARPFARAEDGSDGGLPRRLGADGARSKAPAHEDGEGTRLAPSACAHRCTVRVPSPPPKESGRGPLGPRRRGRT